MSEHVAISHDRSTIAVASSKSLPLVASDGLPAHICQADAKGAGIGQFKPTWDEDTWQLSNKQ